MHFLGKILLAAITIPHVLSFSLAPRSQGNNELLKRSTQPSQDKSLDSTLAVVEIEKRQQCSNQNNQGNDSTQVCGNGNDVGTGSADTNVSTSHGLSRSDKIAVGVGVGGGVVAIVGVLLTYLQLRNRKRRVKQTSTVSQSGLLQPSGLSQQQPQSTWHPMGRSELHE